jgi:hypothetical protein
MLFFFYHTTHLSRQFRPHLFCRFTRAIYERLRAAFVNSEEMAPHDCAISSLLTNGPTVSYHFHNLQLHFSSER